MATPIYHITDIANIPSIVSGKGLSCLRLLQSNNGQHTSIAYASVQSRRTAIAVPCGRGGVLHDYVPFYFAPRSPMLYAIHRGNVSTCTNGQRDTVYLVSNVEAVQASGATVVFTDGHGIMQVTNFYDDLKDLDKIDWPLMRERYWRDTNDDPDRCRRRQAEFLVHDFFPLSLIERVAVMRSSSITVLESHFAGYSDSLTVVAEPRWYY